MPSARRFTCQTGGVIPTSSVPRETPPTARGRPAVGRQNATRTPCFTWNVRGGSSRRLHARSRHGGVPTGVGSPTRPPAHRVVSRGTTPACPCGNPPPPRPLPGPTCPCPSVFHVKRPRDRHWVGPRGPAAPQRPGSGPGALRSRRRPRPTLPKPCSPTEGRPLRLPAGTGSSPWCPSSRGCQGRR